MGHHGTPPQLSPAPRRLCCFSSIPPSPCRCPSSSSSSSTCSSSCSSSRSLHLSSCCSSRCSDGSSCVCIFGVSSFQGFHSFLLMCFINKKQSRACCTMQGSQRHYQSYLFQQHLPAAVLCFPTSFKVQGTRIEI